MTIAELADDLAAMLTEALGERWTTSFPGTPDPSEAWLHGPEHDAASVGVFHGRAVITVEGEIREVAASRRSDLPHAREVVLAAVQQQRALHRRNVAVSERIRSLAPELAAELTRRIGRPCTSTVTHRASHWGSAKAVIACSVGARRKPRENVEIWGERDIVRAHAGLPGRDGWEGDLDDLSGAIDAIAAAAEQSLNALTIDRLVRGKRYRVLETLQELRAGAVVRFRGFDDIDNHYGRYVFETAEGEEVAVSGDFSTPRHSPLAETHRILVELPD